MKFIWRMNMVLVICLIIFSHPLMTSSSAGEEVNDLATQSAREEVSSFEQPTLIQPEGELIIPTTTEASLISFRQASLISGDSGEEPVQTAIANIPPAPAEAEEEVGTIPDPIEPVNRAFFTFNDKLYFWVLKPVATGYKAVAPEEVRVCVRNFFSNLTTPVRLINCLLQADVKCAGIESARFLVNTGLGIVGFFDSAKTGFSLEKQDRDFGQTLGIWGMAPVFYIDVPIIGPSSLRDFLGFIVDVSFDPRTYLAFYISAVSYANTGGWVLDKINEASLTLGEYEELKRAALDPYIALREAYHQYRENKIKKR